MSFALKDSGFVTDTPAEVKSFSGTAGSGSFDTFNDAAGANYQVPAGKVLIITRLILTSGGANGGIVFGDSTASVDNSTIPTGWVDNVGRILNPSANVSVQYSLHKRFETGKFPGLTAITGTAWYSVFGIEVTA